ncbi:hypothetical protein PF010_g7718 [Phytophthora fragariae]|uniref:Uncharacterized protein n=1 Tax=Phytophthora fragariae TaxID=53985 RepID=A0A6G0LGK3_9STRA|nr:hypothetical protein PF010_g7718 [Phytophthora fragariae]
MRTLTSVSSGPRRFPFWVVSLASSVSVRTRRSCVPLHNGRCPSRGRTCVNGSAWPTTCTSTVPITPRWHGH